MASRSTLLVVCAALALAPVVAVAQQPAEKPAEKPVEKPAPVIKKAEIKPTAVGSGLDMYVNYCAACHGLDGKGKGPAAPALKAPLPDLTQLAKLNAGKFPAERVASVLRFGTEVPAHGSADMPTWGPLLRSLNKSQATETQLRIHNLTKHIEGMQAQ